MNANKLFLMLTARAMRYDSVGHGFGGVTSASVACMLKGLPRGSHLMAMAAYARDLDVLQELEGELWRHILELIGVTRWSQDWKESYNEKFLSRFRWPKEHRIQNARRFSGLAVLEALCARPLPCAACKGRGFRIKDSNGVECDECQNSGGQTLSQRMRAELTGVPWSRFVAGWDARYEAVHWIAVGWRGEAISHLARAAEETLEAA